MKREKASMKEVEKIGSSIWNTDETSVTIKMGCEAAGKYTGLKRRRNFWADVINLGVTDTDGLRIQLRREFEKRVSKMKK